MFGKTSKGLRRKRSVQSMTVAMSLALASLLIGVIGLFTPNANLFGGLLGSNCTTYYLGHSVNYVGTEGLDGISAYQVWLLEGNSGSQEDFLNALVGTKGANGYAGKDGKSAYQLWLDEGNIGSKEEFISSLTGEAGVKGVDGLSAYELWLSVGNSGTLQNFLNSLIGAAGSNGANGTNGSNGLSAYEIWRDNGNSGKTVAEFLNSLKGAAGDIGTTGATGAQGPAGPAGPAGADGVCTIGAGGYYASFWDQETQTSLAAVNGMKLGYAGSANGISAVDDAGNPSTPANSGSWIKFANPGTYNIAFSAQLTKTGGSAATISIWLRQKNGTIKNVDYTNTNITLANNSTEMAAAWNFFVDVSAGDQIQLAWHATDPSVQILAQGPTTVGGASIPGIPSVIVTVNQVR